VLFHHHHVKNDHEQLFDRHIVTLKKRGCPLAIIDALRDSKKYILAHVSSIEIAEGNIACMPVITPPYLGYHGLLSLVRHGSESGVIRCDVVQIVDVEKTPLRLYYMFDVEDGSQLLDRTMENANIRICQKNRLPSTMPEIASICILTDVLSRHSVCATGSRYASDRTPIILLSTVGTETDWENAKRELSECSDGHSLKPQEGTPGLGWRYSSSPSRGGASSCSSRLEIPC